MVIGQSAVWCLQSVFTRFGHRVFIRQDYVREKCSYYALTVTQMLQSFWQGTRARYLEILLVYDWEDCRRDFFLSGRTKPTAMSEIKSCKIYALTNFILFPVMFLF